MAPAHNTRSQSCHFLKLPAELRLEIYDLVLLVPETIVVKSEGPFPSDPPLLATCKQIRAEASPTYGQNHLEIKVRNLNMTKFAAWMHLSVPRMALYEGADLSLTMFSGFWEGGPPGGNPWVNLLAWVKDYYHGRVRRIVDRPTVEYSDSVSDDDNIHVKPRSQVELAIKIFDEVEEMMKKNPEVTWAEVSKAVGKHRRAFLRL